MASNAERVTPPAVLERALARERAAREQAEALLESRSRELYLANQALKEETARAQERNAEIEAANVALKEAQSQLVQSEKMASVGQLAAGVAHEINNPIGFIMSNLGTLRDYVSVLTELIDRYRQYAATAEAADPDTALLTTIRETEASEDLPFVVEDIGELLTESIDGTVRVRDIVLGLKSFSRVDNATVTLADLHEGIESTLRVVRNEIKYRCDVERDYSHVPPVRCNIAQINQVLMNLFVNAAQSMATKGTLLIRTYVEADYACIDVSDTGSGIDDATLSKIFDPFFTTKEVGSGTGLGLAISYGIVREHGGEIRVASEVGVGTTFTVALPLGR